MAEQSYQVDNKFYVFRSKEAFDEHPILPEGTPVFIPLTEFAGATSLRDGQAGLVPAPMSGDQTKYLRADGTWKPVFSNMTDYIVSFESNGTPGKTDYQWCRKYKSGWMECGGYKSRVADETTVTFMHPFKNIPVVVIGVCRLGGSSGNHYQLSVVSKTSFSHYIESNQSIYWIATGQGAS